MTTSGTSSFTVTRDDIIKRALRLCGAVASGDTPGSQLVTDAAFALNSMVKEWNALGIHVWCESEAILFLQPGQTTYNLGGTNTDNTVDSQKWTQASLTATAATGATALSVNAITGISASDAIGVVLDSGKTFWTTVLGTPAGTTVNLSQGLPSQASSGNNVLDYTPINKIIRPLRVPFARRYAFAPVGGRPIHTPMIPMSRQDYENLPNKQSPGTPTQFFYAPLIGTGGVGPGQLKIWPVAIDSTNAIRFTWYRPIQDFASANTTPDLPQEWANTLAWNLAYEIGLEYDVPAERWGIIVTKAKESLDRVTGWDREPESIFFGVEMSQR